MLRQERQDAVAQRVELLKSIHEDNEREIKPMMIRLGNNAISHDQRLDDLESR